MNLLFFLTPKENVVYISEEDTIKMVIEKMELQGYTAVPLLSMQGEYIGTVTEGDLLWYLKQHHFHLTKELSETKITDIKRKRDNKAVNVHETMDAMFEKIINQNFVPVVDDSNIFIGIVTRKDLLIHLEKIVKERES